MIFYKTSEEIELLKISNSLVTDTLAELGTLIKPGITTLSLDKFAESYIRDFKGKPAFLGYKNYPNTLCTSVNEQVVHGIPSNYILKEGDIISIDCGVLLNGFYGDAAYTFPVGTIPDKTKDLLITTKESLFKGIAEAKAGKRLGDIGNAIQTHVEAKGYSVVREMVGHGIGRHLHEKPEVMNYGKKGSGILLKKGLVICIEPMINMGTKEIVQEKDGWTIRTKDRQPSAHYELPVCITEDEAILLTTFIKIEQRVNF